MERRRWSITFLGILAAAGGHAAPAPDGTASHFPPGSFRTPRPPYPYVARAYCEQGFSMIRVEFDNTGKVARTSLLQSTGYPELDDNTLAFARAHWTGLPNAKLDVPVDYRLQDHYGYRRDVPRKNG